LAESAYNKRRAQLEAAFEQAQQLFPTLSNWRALSTEMRAQLLPILDTETAARLSYVLDEMQRVNEVQKLCHNLDLDIHNDDNDHIEQALKNIGSLLSQTHTGLKDLYEVSCAELDFLQSSLIELPGIFGARMMGGGFGGCLLVLATENFDTTQDLAELTAQYFQKFDIQTLCYSIQLADGVHLTAHD
jgi:galactokinase